MNLFKARKLATFLDSKFMICGSSLFFRGVCSKIMMFSLNTTLRHPTVVADTPRNSLEPRRVIPVLSCIGSILSVVARTNILATIVQRIPVFMIGQSRFQAKNLLMHVDRLAVLLSYGVIRPHFGNPLGVPDPLHEPSVEVCIHDGKLAFRQWNVTNSWVRRLWDDRSRNAADAALLADNSFPLLAPRTVVVIILDTMKGRLGSNVFRHDVLHGLSEKEIMRCSAAFA